MILLFGGIYNCADDPAYRNYYDLVAQKGLSGDGLTEIGFTLLVFVANKLGLSYTFFRTLVGLIGLLLLQNVAIKFTKKYSIVFLLYIIYPFVLDVIQFQNFLASSIIIYSMKYLIEVDKKNNWKYLIGILISVSIHYVAVFFIPFYFLRKVTVKDLFLICLLVVPFLCFITRSSIIPDLIKEVVGEDLMNGLSFYFKKANWGFLLLWARQLSIFGISYICYIVIKESDLSQSYKVFSEVVVKLNMYLIIICIPLMIFNGNFFRILRPLLFLDYILISQTIMINARKGFYYSILTAAICGFFLISDAFTKANFLTVVTPFFSNNLFLSWF
jgi:hypothetical protein